MPPALIDPRVAGMVARRVSGEGARPPDNDATRKIRDDLTEAVTRAEGLVAEVSGIPAPPPVEWAMVGRGDWAEANITGMAQLIAPLADRLGGRLENMPKAARVVQKSVLSAEVGLMLGYVSRRVLGQYDLLVPEPDASIPRWKRARMPGGGASLYFVGSNMVETTERLGFVPEDFSLWVAVHEVTHRFQFAGVPWLRDTFFDLVRNYLASVDMDVKSFAGRMVVAARKLVDRSTPDEERNAVYLFATEEQRAQLDRMQALMAVVEGHGNYVMDTVGAKVIPTFRRMRDRFDKRRENTHLIQRVVNNAIGLEMKLRQYELGQRFCETVVERDGSDALAYLWSSPSNLPSLEELRTPERWVTARVSGRKWSVSGGPGYEIAEHVANTVARYSMFEGGDVVLVAVSGGPDSMCMLHVLGRLGADLTIHVAHVDHGLSETSEETSATVAKWAAETGYDVHIARARDSAGPNLHARARAFRYSFFETIAREVGAGRIATGHTLNDRVETTLARLIHGAGTEGLAGIHPVMGARIRPLIDVRRMETRSYCEEVALPFVDDPSNEDPRFDRGSVRALVLRAIEERWGEGAVLAMASSAELLREDGVALASQAQLLYEGMIEDDGDKELIDLESLLGMPRALRRRLIELSVGRLRDRAGAIDAVLDALERDHKPGASFDLPGGGTIVIEKEHVVVTRGGE